MSNIYLGNMKSWLSWLCKKVMDFLNLASHGVQYLIYPTCMFGIRYNEISSLVFVIMHKANTLIYKESKGV